MWYFLVTKTKNLLEKKVRLCLLFPFLLEKIWVYVKSLDKSSLKNIKQRLLCQGGREGERGERRIRRRRKSKEEKGKENSDKGKIEALGHPCCVLQAQAVWEAASAWNLFHLQLSMWTCTLYIMHNSSQSIHLHQYYRVLWKLKKKSEVRPLNGRHLLLPLYRVYSAFSA